MHILKGIGLGLLMVMSGIGVIAIVGFIGLFRQWNKPNGYEE